MRKHFCLSAFLMIALSWAISVSGTTITFDEFAATNNNVALTTAYTGIGVTFGPTNSGTWGGNSNGNPGNWGLQGTNGPQFLGFNGINGYSEIVTFSSAVNGVSLDFSRSNGSVDGVITLMAFGTSGLLGTVTATLGAINQWTTLSLANVGITSITWSGTGTNFHPYGVDNFVFNVGRTVPEPGTLVLLFAAAVAAMSRRRKI